ncbi:MAG: enoyl-CoA hydratase/isomerase family protein [Bdellovibrionales bacterium]|nr:enoyl-CoA hydratase/isomerase family protein [Bdellovibrionales bacterium]
MAYETLELKFAPGNRAGAGILTIALNRPDIRNAFNEKMIDELARVFRTEAVDPKVRAVVLRGNGQVFCAGGDLNWMRKSIELKFEENLQDTTTLTNMFALLNEFPKPVVGVIHGAAIGGGVGLVSICDIVFAEKSAVFSLSEVRLGVVPACIGPFVTSKIGAAHARALFVSAERFNAFKAQSVGLVHEVFASMPELEKHLETLTKNLLGCGPTAMTVAKRLVLDLTWPERRTRIGDPIDYVSRTLAELRVGPEAQEGIGAFLEKRKPGWIEGEGDK